MSTDPQQFFDPLSLASFSGATALTWAIVAGFDRFFDFNKKWLPFAAAEGVCVASLLFIPSTGSLGKNAAVAVVNGLFVALASTGAHVVKNSPNGAPDPTQPPFQAQGATKSPLWRWIRPKTKTNHGSE